MPRALLRLLLLSPLLMAAALYLAFDTSPSVDRVAEFSPGNVERAKRILDANDPRKTRLGALQTVKVEPVDLDLAINYLTHRIAGGSARVDLGQTRARVIASVPVPGVSATLFLNLDATLRQGDPFPIVERLRAGRLPIPRWVAVRVVTAGLARALDQRDLEFVRGVVRKVEFHERHLTLAYESHAGLPDRFRTAFVTPDEEDRLRAYHARLVEVTFALQTPTVSLAALVPGVFSLAVERSRVGDPVLENRAALLVLTAYVNGQSLSAIVPDAHSWPRARRHGVTLNQRGDFSQHFIISAALAANAGGPLADAVGLFKEISDARGGSGFSFGDLAADRAGSRLGELAEGADTARRLQSRLAGKLTDRALMPHTADLPESLTEPELKRRFGGVGQPEYERLTAESERRISALPALQ